MINRIQIFSVTQVIEIARIPSIQSIRSEPICESGHIPIDCVKFHLTFLVETTNSKFWRRENAVRNRKKTFGSPFSGASDWKYSFQLKMQQNCVWTMKTIPDRLAHVGSYVLFGWSSQKSFSNELWKVNGKGQRYKFCKKTNDISISLYLENRA